MSEKKQFNNVAFVLLSGIWMACWIMPGLTLKVIPPEAGGLALILLPGMAHAIGLAISIHGGHTEAAIIMHLFLGGFWMYYGIGLLYLTPAAINATMKFVEPGVAISLCCLQRKYKEDKSLRGILIWLAGTIVFLWLSKFYSPLETIVPYAIWALGAGTQTVGMYQLEKRPKAEK